MNNFALLLVVVVALAIHEINAHRYPGRNFPYIGRGRGLPGIASCGEDRAKPRSCPCAIVNTTSTRTDLWRKDCTENRVCEVKDQGRIAEFLSGKGLEISTCKPKVCLEDNDCIGDNIVCREGPRNTTFKICLPPITFREALMKIICSDSGSNDNREMRYRCNREREDEEETDDMDDNFNFFGDDQDEDDDSSERGGRRRNRNQNNGNNGSIRQRFFGQGQG